MIIIKKKIFYLSPKEYDIMTILWNSDKPLTVSEILELRKEGTWSKNSIHPLLNSLLEKNFISVVGTQKVSKVNSRLYIPNIDLSDYISAQVSKVFKNNKLKFNLSSFLSNFIGSDEEVDEKLVEELEEWLNNYNDTENNKYK